MANFDKVLKFVYDLWELRVCSEKILLIKDNLGNVKHCGGAEYFLPFLGKIYSSHLPNDANALQEFSSFIEDNRDLWPVLTEALHACRDNEESIFNFFEMIFIGPTADLAIKSFLSDISAKKLTKVYDKYMDMFTELFDISDIYSFVESLPDSLNFLREDIYLQESKYK